MSDTHDHRAKDDWIRRLSDKPLVMAGKVLLYAGVLCLAAAILFTVGSWLWPSSNDRVADSGYTDRDGDGDSDPPAKCLGYTSCGVKELDGDWYTVNPGGSCIVAWRFEGLIDVANRKGEVREDIDGYTKDDSFWPAKVRAATDKPVEFHYWLNC